MITTTIGKIFLTAYNQKYATDYSPRDFFDKVYYPLFYDSNKYMQWVQNSPFVQMKKGQKVETLLSAERQEKLSALHQKVDCGTADASIAIGYAASENKEYATTSGQVTNIPIPLSKDDVYLSWLGSSLGVGFQGGLSVLFPDPDLLLTIFDGWAVYRKLLDSNENLKGNQIGTWNGRWIAHRYGRDFDESDVMANFDLFEEKNGEMSIKTQSWSKALVSLALHYKKLQMTGYVYNLGQTNTTIGFIPFVLSEIRRPVDLYKKIFGTGTARQAEDLWGTERGLRICCQEGAIGVKAMAPKGVRKMISGETLPKIKKNDEKQTITYNTYIIWILAMLNNENLWDLSQEFAQSLHDYIRQDEKKLSKQKTNLVENVLKSTTKKSFLDSLVEIVKDSNDKERIVSIAKEVNTMPSDNVPYFLTLIRFNYASIN